MSLIRPPTQVHDGFATIRTRGLCRTKSRAEQIDRCRAVSLKTTSDDNNKNSNDLNFLKNQQLNDVEVELEEEPYYSSPKSLPYSTFRPLLNDPTRKPSMISLSPEYQNVVKKSQFSLESLSSSTTTQITPNDDYQDQKEDDDDDIFLYSAPDSPQYCNINITSIHRHTVNELDHSDSPARETFQLQNLLHKPNIKKPPPPLLQQQQQQQPQIRYCTSAGIQNKRTSFSADCKSNDGSCSSNGEINNTDGSSNGSYNINTYNNPMYCNDIYNPCAAPLIINRNRSTSTELLVLKNDRNFGQTIEEQQQQQQQQQHKTSNNLFVRRYHTLGHPRCYTAAAAAAATIVNPNSMKTEHSNASDDRKFIKTSWQDGINTNYVDPLDFKIGCQTMLRSKPIIPWYELAIRKDIKRKSCPPPMTNQKAVFDQSLTNMTAHLQQLTSSDRHTKIDDLTDMRHTIDQLRKQSIQSGHRVALNSNSNSNNDNDNFVEVELPSAGDNIVLVNRQQRQHQPLIIQTNHNFNLNDDGIKKNFPGEPITYNKQLHQSTDSICSINSICSTNSIYDKKKLNKRNWIRNSLTRAFSRNSKFPETDRHSGGSNFSDFDQNLQMNSRNNGPAPAPAPTTTKSNSTGICRNSITSMDSGNSYDMSTSIDDLKKQLREKDLILTDIRLEALNSASQMESLKETVIKLHNEIKMLKQNNERLHKLLSSQLLDGSNVSLGQLDDCLSKELPINEKSLSLTPLDFQREHEFTLTKSSLNNQTKLFPSYQFEIHNNLVNNKIDGKKIAITVYLGHPETLEKHLIKLYDLENFYHSEKELVSVEIHNENSVENKMNNDEMESKDFIIANTYISGKTTWQHLDNIVRKSFKDYLTKIDPGKNLGLNIDCIQSYYLGEAKRTTNIKLPELLPCGYIIGNVKKIHICLQDNGNLTFDCLIPRSIIQRYISLLVEHKRLIICGPSGTGKSYIGKKLAEFIAPQNQSTKITTIDVKHKSSAEIMNYIDKIVNESCKLNADNMKYLPSVIILENLPQTSSVDDVFSCLRKADPTKKLPHIIGTISQTITNNITNLQLHNNFRWVLTANHMEPIKGFLGRFLRRQLYAIEMEKNCHQPELNEIINWLIKVWQNINRYLENHSSNNSSDVTIGPRLFLSCPLDLKDSQVWFTDVWNYQLAPYIIEKLKDNSKLNGKRENSCKNPLIFIRDTYPWSNGLKSMPPLKQINDENIIMIDDKLSNEIEKPDPLLNILIRLQEANNVTMKTNIESEYDCISIGSSSSPDSSAST